MYYLFFKKLVLLMGRCISEAKIAFATNSTFEYPEVATPRTLCSFLQAIQNLHVLPAILNYFTF